jgi:hypothetical protein
MSGDTHVRICESLGVRFPRATRLLCSSYRLEVRRIQMKGKGFTLVVCSFIRHSMLKSSGK